MFFSVTVLTRLVLNWWLIAKFVCSFSHLTFLALARFSIFYMFNFILVSFLPNIPFSSKGLYFEKVQVLSCEKDMWQNEMQILNP